MKYLRGIGPFSLARHPAPIRTHLVMLAVAVLLPALMFSTVAVLFVLRLEHEAAERATREIARAIALSLDRELASAIAALKVLATSVNLTTGDLRAFREQANTAITTEGAWIVLFDRSAQQLVNTGFPLGTKLPPRTNPDRVAQIIAAPKPDVSDLYMGALAKRPILAIDVPVVRDNAVKYVLTMILRPETLGHVFLERQMPADWITAIFDRKGITLARTLNPEQFVGQPGRPELLEQLAITEDGWFRNVTRDGVPVYNAFTRSKLTGWSVVVGVPATTINAPAWRALWTLGIGVATAAVLGILLAIGIGKGIGSSMRRLTASAKVVGSGTPIRPVESQITEVNEVGQALEATAKLLDDRLMQLKHAEEQQQMLNQDLEQRVAARTAELEEANGQLEAFSYSVSHDLRAPLRAMHGFSHALLEEYADRLDATGQKYAERIRSSAEHMDKIIQDLLAYSRLSRTGIRLQEVNLDLVIEDAIQQLSGDLRDRNAQLRVAKPLPTVVGHHQTLVQIVCNLLSNAIKFVADSVRPEIHIWPELVRSRVRLYIQDNGIGIETEYHEKIFNVFERLHGKDRYPGTGIGLSIVRKGIERMGGQVGVQSAPNHGSRFWIELPTAVHRNTT